MDVRVQGICANDEEIRNLKRKMEELDDKEAVIKKHMGMESAASSVRKKPRILVQKWLKEIERARYNFQIIGQADAETLPPKEQVETLTREAEELIGRTPPPKLLGEARHAKGDAFLERKLIGEGIHRNIEFIWARLKENDARKFCIYGMGGVGKTTIMMHIHNRLLEDATFDGVAFITVSQNFSNYNLQSDIWKALKFGDMKDEHEKKRAAKLSKRLERKKNCVLILDDVWECIDLEEVGIPIKSDGFKLVLTTRSYGVCRQMQCQEEIKIKPLSQKEAESLFLEELGSEVALNQEIEAVVNSIVKECAGLPIGIITMAKSMRGVTNVFEWRDSLVKLKESSMGQTDMEKKVLMNLKFSYDRLGNPDVQQCFLSCALYPEDELIDGFKLVEFFIDQGLVGGLDTRKEQYDRGLAIQNNLVNVCLLEDLGFGRIKMHDLIRDMALHIMSATSLVKAGKKLKRIPSKEKWTDALQKVSLVKNNIRAFPLDMSPNCPKLSTLLLEKAFSHDVVIPDSFFKNLLGLKVLNLSKCYLTELPNSISDLVNLRALLLSGCRKLCRIPYIGKLTSLRKLDASGCESLDVLEGLEKLVDLRYLDLTKTRIKRLPTGTLEHLLNLQYLKIWAVIEEDFTKLEALETFSCHLEDADADDFNRFLRVIEHGDRYYRLQVDLKKSEFMVEVSEEPEKPTYEPLERSVDILGWSSVGGECSGIFSLVPRDVQALKMTKCDSITSLSGKGPLEHLEELEIREWENLRLLCGGHDEEVIDIHDSPAPTPTPLLFSSLRVLDIYYCPKLKYLFGHGSLSNLSHLQEIKISGCEEMVGIIAAVTSPHPLPAFPSLDEISIDGCHKMKRAVESEWLPHFPNLRTIKVTCCEKMVEMISGAGQGQEGSIMTLVNNTPSSFQSSISLPNLRELKLWKLPQLKSICGVPISCGSMVNLRAYKCPELKAIPLQLRLRNIDIKDLPHIWVEDEEKWKTLMWDHPDAQAILQPYLRKGEHANIETYFPWMNCCSPNAIG
ncbi:hypothetical protein BT93_F1066 [Corymbia citriodora subsp. variegata]|nr:hypothetical protein BT93_F1066 [Corymbia citriodora subsp. variegata]